MFDEKVILTRLQNGESVEDIANEMANLINKVNKTYADQKAAEEAAKAAAAKAEIQKAEKLQYILDRFIDWFGTYYDVDIESIKNELNADSVIELIDSIKECVDTLKDLEAMFDIKKPAVKATKSNAKSKSKSSDEKISDFLKQMGW